MVTRILPPTQRYCKNCNAPLPLESARNRLYCNECRVIVNKQKSRERDKELREKKRKVYADPTRWKPDAEDVAYCKPCIYSEASYWHHLCNFYTRTGVRRGCKAGKGCIKREMRSSLNGK